MPMDYATALAKVAQQTQANVAPGLTEEEITDLLLGAMNGTTWTPSTTYAYDDIVRPTVPNGHIYRCIVAGTSGTEEPYWPMYTAGDPEVGLTKPHWHGFFGMIPYSQVGEGNNSVLQWVEAGYDLELYHVERAVYEGWLLKAGKVSNLYDVGLDQNSIQATRSQLLEHCLKMADRYIPTGFA